MKIAIFVLFLTTAAASAQMQPLTPPKACGPMNLNFETDTEDAHPTNAPIPGKAMVYFINDNGPEGDEHQHYTLRVGLDGMWVGAYKRNSFFTADLNPGEHHLCINVQSGMSVGRNFALAHFTAQPGEIYYFRTRFMAGMATQYPMYPYLDLDRPDSDEAKYLISRYPLTRSHSRK